MGYRHALHAEALRLGLDGWVRNRRDGSVETLVSGDAGAVRTLTAWAAHGPPSARVERVQAGAPPSGLPPLAEGFATLPTA